MWLVTLRAGAPSPVPESRSAREIPSSIPWAGLRWLTGGWIWLTGGPRAPWARSPPRRGIINPVEVGMEIVAHDTNGGPARQRAGLRERA